MGIPVRCTLAGMAQPALWSWCLLKPAGSRRSDELEPTLPGWREKLGWEEDFGGRKITFYQIFLNQRNQRNQRLGDPGNMMQGGASMQDGITNGRRAKCPMTSEQCLREARFSGLRAG